MLDTTRKTILITGTAAPEEVIDHAEVCILTASACHVYGRGKHISIVTDETELPELACPIVDISNLGQELDESVADAMTRYHRTQDLADLLESLSNLGATVTQRPCPLCISTPMNCITCTFGGLK